jgi:hypothetical protein
MTHANYQSFSLVVDKMPVSSNMFYVNTYNVLLYAKKKYKSTCCSNI